MQADARPGLRSDLLHALADILEASGVAAGEVQRVTRARIPLLRFQEAETGVPCDICFSNEAAVTKSQLLQCAVAVDARAAHLVRLVCSLHVRPPEGARRPR
jgi:DNA polymerase sigma